MKKYLNPFNWRKKQILPVVVVLVLYVIVSSFIPNSNTQEEVLDDKPVVETIRIKDLDSKTSTISTVGEIESEDQVFFRSQVVATVSSINVEIGDKVSKGQILVSLDNRDEAAAYKQSLANLEAERVKLEELRTGSSNEDRSIAETRLQNANISYEEAQESLEITKSKAQEELDNLYDSSLEILIDVKNKLDNSVNVTLDDLFENDDEYNVRVSFNNSDFNLEKEVREQRRFVNEILFKFSDYVLLDTNNKLTVDSTLDNTKKDLLFVKDFLFKLSELVNDSVGLDTDVESTYKSSVNTARTNINSALDSILELERDIEEKIAANRNTIKIAETSLTSAENTIKNERENLNKVESGTRNEQIRSQEARVRSLEAALGSSGARLSKTIFRSPINGEVATVPVKVGDLVTSGQLVAGVVDRENLKVKAFIDLEQISQISIGSEVIVGGNSKGIVDRIAPSVDPETRKVEIDVRIIEGTQNLIVGQYVEIEITTNNESEGFYLFPLSSVRISTAGDSVLFVDEENIVRSIDITKGRIIGDLIEVYIDLPEDTKIIKSVRGLEIGEEVEVYESN